MDGFSIQKFEKQNLVRFVLHHGNERNWNLVSEQFRQQTTSGVMNWELDLRDIKMLESIMIGNAVLMMTSIRARGGSFRLLVRKDSHIANTLRMAKINLIMDVMENAVA